MAAALLARVVDGAHPGETEQLASNVASIAYLGECRQILPTLS
jgi:hypothetical protein